jgi:hypothetical protein
VPPVKVVITSTNSSSVGSPMPMSRGAPRSMTLVDCCVPVVGVSLLIAPSAPVNCSAPSMIMA